MTEVTELPREKTLHELNLEQRRIDRALRNRSLEAGEAAKDAVVETLDGKRMSGKRMQKNLRPVAE